MLAKHLRRIKYLPPLGGRLL